MPRVPHRPNNCSVRAESNGADTRIWTEDLLFTKWRGSADWGYFVPRCSSRTRAALLPAGNGSAAAALRPNKGMKLSLPGEALQFVESAVHEFESAPVDELPHRR